VVLPDRDVLATSGWFADPPASSRCVAKQCLSVCGCTSFLEARSLRLSCKRFQTTLVSIGVHRYASGCLETAIRLLAL